MFDALWMSNFCCAVYLRWNDHCGQFSASCNIEIQKNYFPINKLKSCLMHSGCPIFCCAVYLRLNDHCGQFLASCNIEIRKKSCFHKQALNHVWCTLDVQFLLCCLFEMKLTLWTVFSKLQHWNTEKLFFP